MPYSFDSFCSLWLGTDLGGRMRGMHPLPAIFKVVLNVYNFSIISNLFDSDKPYALSTHNRKCANKMHHILRSTQIRVKQFEQNLPENYSKRTKITIRACKFLKIFRGSMLPDPPWDFLASQSASNLFCRKKYSCKKCGNYGSPLLKFLAAPLNTTIGL